MSVRKKCEYIVLQNLSYYSAMYKQFIIDHCKNE